MSEELEFLPCPACMSEYVSVISTDLGSRGVSYSVICNTCHTQSTSAWEQEKVISAWNDLPRALVWTTEPPTVSGLYWHRFGDVITTRNVAEGDIIFIKEDDCKMWAGPIPAPKEPTP